MFGVSWNNSIVGQVYCHKAPDWTDISAGFFHTSGLAIPAQKLLDGCFDFGMSGVWSRGSNDYGIRGLGDSSSGSFACDVELEQIHVPGGPEIL